MKTNSKKGFVIVELVIVIAVIAILAAALIPTFSGLFDSANKTADEMAVREMNTALLMAELKGGVDSFYDAKLVLTDAKFNVENGFVPITTGYIYAWDAENNEVVLLAKDSPEAKNATRYFDLSIPAAKVDNDGAQKVTTQEGEVDLAVSYTFTANKAENAIYNDWYADFYISFNNTDKVEGITLAGYYEAWCVNGNWVGATVNEDLKSLLDDNGYVTLIGTITGESNWTYDDIQTVVQVFKCGVADDGTHTGAEMTVELRLTNPADANEYKVVGTYTYAFK